MFLSLFCLIKNKKVLEILFKFGDGENFGGGTLRHE